MLYVKKCQDREELSRKRITFAFTIGKVIG